MFAQAETARQKDYDHTVCQGQWQHPPNLDLRAEAPAIELVTYENTWEEIMGVYNEVYQLKRNPMVVPCSEETVEEISIEILETLKECLWHRQGSAQPEEEQRWRSTGTRTYRMPAQAEFHAQMQATFDHLGHFQNR